MRISEFLPLILVGVNALCWLGLLAVRVPLPTGHFDAGGARVQKTTTGISVVFIDHADPHFILAERAIINPLGRTGVPAGLMLLANLPALVTIAPLAFVPDEPACGGFGSRATSWIRTMAFGIASSLQWWWMGAALRAFARWRRQRHPTGAPRSSQALR